MKKPNMTPEPVVSDLCAKLSELAMAFNRDLDDMAGPHADTMRNVAAASQVGHALSNAANPVQALNTIMTVLLEVCESRGVSFQVTATDPPSMARH